jgi:hypothetical protein
MAKKTAGKAAAAAPVKGLTLTAAQMKKAQACLDKSGAVKVGFKEVSFTKLPKSISPVAVFID